MSIRSLLHVLVPLLAVSSIHAQTKPTTQPGSQPSKDKLQQEVTGVAETPEQRVAKLQQQLKKVDEELKHITTLQQNGGMVGHVQRSLGLRSNKYRTYAPPAPKTRPNTGGRVRKLSDEESMGLPAGTRLVINGEPVLDAEYKRVADYLKTFVKNELAVKKLTVHNLALQKAAIAENPKSAKANRERLKLAHNRLVEGEIWDRVCQELSDCPSIEKNGDLGFIKQADRDPLFMAHAMALEPGDRSNVIESTEGYHVIECLAKKDNSVHVRHVLVRYSDEVSKVHALVRRGNVDIASNNAADIEGMAPKKTPVRTVPAPVRVDGAKIKKGAELKKAEKAKGTAEKAKGKYKRD